MIDTRTHNKSFWEFFLHHRRFTLMLIVMGILIGFISMMQIPRESTPEVDIPIGFVTVVFPGAGAEDVEELVTDVIEDKVVNLDDVKKVTSTSREGVSTVVIEYEADADSEERVRELKDKVDEIKPDLPEDAQDPIVQKVRYSDMAIYTIAMSGPYSVSELNVYADELESRLENVPGVSNVSISGGREKEIKVIVDPALLDKFGLSISQVTSAISQANTDIPAGSIETGGSKYNIRLSGQINTVNDVRSIPITSLSDVPVLVEDVATIQEGEKEVQTLSRLSVDGGEPLPSLTLNIFKAGGGNIIDISDMVDERIEEYRQKAMPEDVVFETIYKDADLIKEQLNSLVMNGLGTIVIVVLVLYFFIGFREALLAGLAIPISFIFTFIFLSSAGSTINFLSLFSLILALGILIDGAVVMTQGMHSRIQQGSSPIQAATLTIRDFHLPLIAGTLTTVFAFLPMLLMSGIMGEFIKHIPITVTLVLMSSLLVALGFIPTLGVRWLGKNPAPKQLKSGNGKEVPREQEPSTKEQRWKRILKECVRDRKKIFERLSTQYRTTLMSLVESKKKRRIVLWSLVGGFMFSIFLPLSGILKIEMFPNEDQDFMFVGITLPIGTPIEQTTFALEKVEKVLLEQDQIASFSSNVGQSAPNDEGSISSGSHLANALINLKEKRKNSSVELIEIIQESLSEAIDFEFSVGQYGSGPPSGAPVEIVVTGPNLQTIEELALVFEDVLLDISGARDVNTTIQERSGEFVLQIDRAKAQIYGISTAQLAGILRNAVSGVTATTIKNDGEEVDVVVKYALNNSTVVDGRTNIIDINDIEAITIATQKGDIPLSSFTKTDLSGTRPVIEHSGGERVIRVTSFTKQGVSAAEVFDEVTEYMKEVEIPEGYNITLGGEQEDVQQSFNDMFRAMFLAIFLIGVAMVLQFDSFKQPLFILVTIPLALIAVFPGLVLVGKPFSFPAVIGVVALVGIVVNNAIILIDQINRLREDGYTKEEAIIMAGNARLEPIILTTVTTILGILPITLTEALWGPLGYSIIFGLAFSTFSTLFVIPLLYRRFGEEKL